MVQPMMNPRSQCNRAIDEVSRGLEVSPNVLHRWVREFRQAPGNAFPGQGQRRWSDGRGAELERKMVSLLAWGMSTATKSTPLSISPDMKCTLRARRSSWL